MIDFSKRVALNYDCLRAIAFEINNDQDFSTAIQDLNIINVDEEKFRICVLFKDGTKLANTKVMMDSFSNDIKRVSLYDANKRYAGDVSFMPAQIGYNSITRELNLKSDNIELEYYDYDLDDNENRQMEQDLRKREIQKVLIERIASNDLHYRWR